MDVKEGTTFPSTIYSPGDKRWPIVVLSEIRKCEISDCPGSVFWVKTAENTVIAKCTCCLGQLKEREW